MVAFLPTLRIDPEIGQAWSVPAPFYTDPSVLALEREEPAFPQLRARALQREAGEGRARVSQDVCGSDAERRALTASGRCGCCGQLETNPFLLLQICHDFEQIAGVRISGWAKHPH